MNQIQKLLKALERTGCSDYYNIQLTLKNNGKIIVTFNDSKGEISFKDWIDKQEEEPREIINTIVEELKDCLYEENRFYLDDLTGEDYQILYRYRQHEYASDDDADDSRCEIEFLRDLAEYGVSLEELVKELKRKKNKGVRKYSDKTKDKARKVILEWMKMCDQISYPTDHINELLIELYGEEDDYADDFYYCTPQEITDLLIQNYPIVCGKDAQKKIQERIEDTEMAESMSYRLLRKLKEAFPDFYKKVEEYKKEDKESVYCIAKLPKAHMFHPLAGKPFKSKMFCLFEEEILAGRYWVPFEDTLYSPRDYMWLMEQIPNITLGRVKYYHAD